MKTLFISCGLLLLSLASIAQAQSTSEKTTGARPVQVSTDTPSPLFILKKPGEKDQEISREEINKINGDDLLKIDVLKDSTEIRSYGEKGKYGVVIVHLKDKKTKKQ